VSGLLARNEDTAVVKVFDALMTGKIIPVVSEAVISEYHLVLTRPKFNFPQSLIESILNAIVQIGMEPEVIDISINLPDPKDLIFYEPALSKDGSYLVTGNLKHFPKEPFVVSPSEMVEILQNCDLA
jgi:predicted nucleic acid-binding protein